MGAKHPLDQWNLLISEGFQAPTGAEPPLESEKNLSPPPGQIPEYAPGPIVQYSPSPICNKYSNNPNSYVLYI